MTGRLFIAFVLSWAVLLVAAFRTAPIFLDYWRTWRAAR